MQILSPYREPTFGQVLTSPLDCPTSLGFWPCKRSFYQWQTRPWDSCDTESMKLWTGLILYYMGYGRLTLYVVWCVPVYSGTCCSGNSHQNCKNWADWCASMILCLLRTRTWKQSSKTNFNSFNILPKVVLTIMDVNYNLIKYFDKLNNSDILRNLNL